MTRIVSLCLILVLPLALRAAMATPEVAVPYWQDLNEDLNLWTEEKLGVCERGTMLFFVDKWIPGQLVCGCCLKPRQVFRQTCVDGKDPEDGCDPRPYTHASCCSKRLEPEIAQWYLDEQKRKRSLKRIFDLPTENLNTAVGVGTEDNVRKFGGSSGKIDRRSDGSGLMASRYCDDCGTGDEVGQLRNFKFQ